MEYIKDYDRIDRHDRIIILNVKTTKHKERKKWLPTLDKTITVALIEINLYSVLSLYLFIQFLECSAKYAYCTWNKALFVLFVYYVYL